MEKDLGKSNEMIGRANKLIKIVRIMTWIALISLAFLSVYYKFDDCNVCKFEIDGEMINGKQFMDIYQDSCLNKQDYWYGINITNFSNIKS